ncbi:hypothetical protein BDR03DRAFT_831517, partial [Suillus americanus]
ATQRLAEWRSNFGSTGLAIMIDFFARNKDTDPKDLSEALLDDFVFLYEDMDCSDSMKAFRSPTQLERAIKCLGAGSIDINSDILDMRPVQMKRKLRTPKTFNKSTGKDSTTEHAFSISNWGSVTGSY